MARTTAKKLTRGTPVEVTIRGRVTGIPVHSPHDAGYIVSTNEGTSAFVNPNGRSVVIKPLPPEHPPTRRGQVWQTSAGRFFARVSRRDLPLRFTPDDLSHES